VHTTITFQIYLVTFSSLFAAISGLTSSTFCVGALSERCGFLFEFGFLFHRGEGEMAHEFIMRPKLAAL
jgi:hypothetical protein